MERDPVAADQRIEDVWRDHRAYLLRLAAQVLRDPIEAEDVLQEAFGRLSRVDLAEIEDTRAWLAVVVRRLCLDRLGSAHARRESVAGLSAWQDQRSLPASPGGDGDPADRVTLDDQVQFALAIVLDRLSPAERTAFVLHDVFGFPFTAVGEMVGRTPTACRQLASRARRSIRADDALASPLAEVDQHQLLAERFIAACAGGDMAELIAVLDPDVVGEATFVGGALIGRVAGREEMAQRALIFLGPKSGRTLVPVPGTDGPVVLALDDDDRVVAVMRIEAAAGVVHRVSTVVAPPG